MASLRDYRQIGVFLPVERDDSPRVIFDGAVLQNDDFMKDGFLFVKAIQMGHQNRINPQGERLEDQCIFLVQSVSTGELFANKLIEQPWDPVTRLSLPPSELRVSTYPHAVGDPNIDITPLGQATSRKGVLPDVPYFNKLRWWQELDPQDVTNPNCTVYSIFFQFCNGGTVRQLMEQYNERAIAIPEHFIWLVAEQLFLALVTINFGSYPAQGGVGINQPNNWARIYHRDMHAANIFINYPRRGPGRTPKAGVEGNAFPEIMVGDFGASAIEGDNAAVIQAAELAIQALEEWEDIFTAGEILREMSMTHIPRGGNNDNRPYDRYAQDVNQLQTAPPYSPELIALLQRFEFPGGMWRGAMSLGDARHTTFPSPAQIRDTLLPQARARVQGFRRPANRPPGYYDAMDVSWTKPPELRPLNYKMEYATEAGDGPDGGPPSEHDSGGSEGNHDGNGSGGDAEGDAEMSDSPPSSKAGQDDPAQPADSPQQPEDSPEGSGGKDDDNHADDDDRADDDDHTDDDNHADDFVSPVPVVRPPEVSSERRAMRDLGLLHKWNGAKPRYELRGLEFRVPVMLPFNAGP